MSNNIRFPIVALSVFSLIGIGFIVFLGYAFWAVNDNEPQDIRVFGETSETQLYFDDRYIGKGTSVCVPDVTQGKHRIKQGTLLSEIIVGDVGLRIVDSESEKGKIAELSNCNNK